MSWRGGRQSGGRGGYGGHGGHGGGRSGGPPGNQRVGPKDVEFMAELFDREARDDSAISCMVLEPNSNLLFVGYKSGVVRQWECANWADARTNTWRIKNSVPMGTNGPVTAMHIVGDPNSGGFLFVGCMTAEKIAPKVPPPPAVVRFFSTMGSGDLQGHAGKVDAITSGGTAQYVLWTAGNDRTIRGWIARPEACTFDQQIQFDGTSATKLECMGDILLASDAVGVVSVFHVPSRAKVQEFKAHDLAVSGLLFAEGHLFTSSLDKKVRIWSFFPQNEWGMNQVVRSQGPVLEQPGFAQGSKKEFSMIVSLALLKDLNNRHVALVSYSEGVVRLFRPEDGKFKFGGFIKDYSMGTVISPGPLNSGYFMVGSEKGRVQVWRFRAGVAADEEQ